MHFTEDFGERLHDMTQAISDNVHSPAFLFRCREKVDLVLHPNAGVPSSEPSTDTGTSQIEDKRMRRIEDKRMRIRMRRKKEKQRVSALWTHTLLCI